MAQNDGRPDVEQLVEQLKQRVEERRAAGDYPEELESQLAAHFERISAHRVIRPNFEILYAQLDNMARRLPMERSKISVKSRVPGGTLFHRIVGKIVARQTQGVLEQVQFYAQDSIEIMRATLRMFEDPNSHHHADLIGHIDTLYELAARRERGAKPDLSLDELANK